MQRGVGGEKLRRTARMPLQPHPRRFEKIRIADVLDYFFVVAGIGTEEGIAKSPWCFEDRRVGSETFAGKKGCFSAVARRVAGVERFHHRPLLAMNAAAAGSGNAKGRFDLVDVQ